MFHIFNPIRIAVTAFFVTIVDKIGYWNQTISEMQYSSVNLKLTPHAQTMSESIIPSDSNLIVSAYVVPSRVHTTGVLFNIPTFLLSSKVRFLKLKQLIYPT